MASSNEPVTFPLGKYQLEIEEIGKGAFGIVYKGVESDSGAAIAAKKIRYKERDEPVNDVLYKMGNTELQIIKRLQKHNNIVRLLDHQDDGRCHWIIMEFCDRGDLLRYFKNSPVDLSIKLKVISECASAIAFMHGLQPPIVHRDIKPQNVLMKRQNNEDVAKITDFGIGKLHDDKTKSHLTMTTAVGTTRFMAPEFFDIPDGYLKYQPGIDTFALGLLFHVILTYGEDSKDMIPLSEESKETGQPMAFGFEMVNSSKLNHPPPVLFKGIIHEEDMPEVKKLKSMIHQMISYRVQDRMPLIDVKDTALEINSHFMMPVMKTKTVSPVLHVSDSRNPNSARDLNNGTTGSTSGSNGNSGNSWKPAYQKLDEHVQGLQIGATAIGSPRPPQASSYQHVRSGVHVIMAKVADITYMNVTALVNFTDQNLHHGGGVALAIARAAGQDLVHECNTYIRKNGHLDITGTFVSRGAYLPASKVIHTVGPQSGHNDAQISMQLLGATFYNVLDAAHRNCMSSLAIPGISLGTFGMPLDLVAEIAVNSITQYLENTEITTLYHIYFVGMDSSLISYIESHLDNYVHKGVYHSHSI